MMFFVRRRWSLTTVNTVCVAALAGLVGGCEFSDDNGAGGGGTDRSGWEDCDPATEIDSNVDADATWSVSDDECPDYLVTTGVSVNAELTIDPGVIVLFDAGTRMSVEGNGALTTEGTAEAPVFLTGVNAEPGYWNGVWYESSTRALNRLEHTVIEYAGGEAQHTSLEAAALSVSRAALGASVALDNVTLRQSAGYGLAAHGNADFEAFEENVLTENEAPAWLWAHHLVQLDSETDFSGNESDAIAVGRGNIGADGTVPAANVPYVSWGISTSADVTVSAGAEFQFADEARWTASSGEIIFAGTEQAPIIMRGTEGQPGWWVGVHIESTEAQNNRAEHLVIEDAGRDGGINGTEPAAFTVARSGQSAAIAVENSTIRDSAGHGLYVHGNGTLRAFERNTFEGNEGFGASLDASDIPVIDRGSTFEDNGPGGLGVRRGTINADGTWRDAGIDWVIGGDVSVSNDQGELVIEAGTRLLFRDDVRLQVHGGMLHVEGESGNPVVMEGYEPEAGWWRGLYFQSERGAEFPTVEHLELRHAGSSAQRSRDPAGITVGRSGVSARAIVTDSVIEEVSHQDDPAAGIYVHSTAEVNPDSDICVENTFDDIDGQDCVVD